MPIIILEYQTLMLVFPLPGVFPQDPRIVLIFSHYDLKTITEIGNGQGEREVEMERKGNMKPLQGITFECNPFMLAL